MNFALLADPHLLLVALVSGLVSMLTTLNVAARPAAVRSRQVASTFTIAQFFFMLTRFANLFYLPIMAAFVDRATRTGRVDVLYQQIQFVILGAAGGALMSWVLLPTFVEVYTRGVRSLLVRQSLLGVLLRLGRISGWRTLLSSFRPPGNLGIRLFRLEGVPADFLWFNVLATAVWTVGALCAVYVSAVLPSLETTALLLSGLVNAVAAICFTIFVDPKAALITDRAVRPIRLLHPVPRQLFLCLASLDSVGASLAMMSTPRQRRGRLQLLPPTGPSALELFAAESDPHDRQVRITAVHLAAGNLLGSVLGLFVFSPGIHAIEAATRALGAEGSRLVEEIGFVVVLNVLVTMLASTTVAGRVSAVLTRQVASALAIYNFFFLITRLAQQVYAPVLGSIRDAVASGSVGPQGLPQLESLFRQVLAGASLGAFLGWLLMPTFIELYRQAIGGLERHRSIPGLLVRLLIPANWARVLGCLRPPSLLGFSWKVARRLPKPFLIGNVVVIAVHTVGVMAAIYASALSHELSRTCTLLSSVVNGVATITLSVIVDPKVALITDDTIEGRRPMEQLNAMAVLLMGGMLLGTVLSQVLLVPSAYFILWVARLVGATFG
ncbi:MAG: hypothetical protein AMXMBFR33_60680 [Candidatus Xenobia bacterium]